MDVSEEVADSHPDSVSRRNWGGHSPIWLDMHALLLLALLQQDKARELEIRKATAQAMADLAEWCGQRKLRVEARAWCDEALLLFPDQPKAKALRPKVDGDNEADDAAVKEYAKKLEASAKKFAKGYRELAIVKHPAQDDARFDGYLIRAYELDSKGTDPIFQAEWRAAYQKKDLERVHRLLSSAEKVKPDEKNAKVLREVEYKLAETKPILRTAKGHPIQYYLALPKNWTPDKTWPILVTVEGAGCNWLGNCNAFLGARGDRPFILVTPLTFCNTNKLDKGKYPGYPQDLLDEVDKSGRLPWDEAGLLAILEDVRKDFHGQEKFFITGFSGGGNLTWRMIFGHPEKLAGAAPACANFYMTGAISQAPERETVPVRAFQGDKDEYLNGNPNLNAQWETAKKYCDENGYQNVTRTMLPGVGHSACVNEVLKAFDELLKK